MMGEAKIAAGNNTGSKGGDDFCLSCYHLLLYRRLPLYIKEGTVEVVGDNEGWRLPSGSFGEERRSTETLFEAKKKVRICFPSTYFDFFPR